MKESQFEIEGNKEFKMKKDSLGRFHYRGKQKKNVSIFFSINFDQLSAQKIGFWKAVAIQQEECFSSISWG